MAELGHEPPFVGEAFPQVRFSVTALDLDDEGVAFAPRYYCPRCGPTNRIMSANGRLICVVCDYDLAQMIEKQTAFERGS
jgi:ribosomal protein S27AE